MMSRFQVFTLDLFLSMLAFLIIIPVLVYLQYNYTFKILHIKKVNVMISRYYPVANVLGSICLAKIDNNTGKLLPYYFQFNETIMFAADNFSSAQDGANYICEKIFGYNASNQTQQQLYQQCVQYYLPYVEFCKNLDDNYDWFLVDQFGAVYFISKHLRLNIPGATRLEKRLFLSYVINKYIYGKSYPTLNFPDYSQYERSLPLVVLVPMGGVSGDYAPVFFIQLADGKYYRTNPRTVDLELMRFLADLWNVRKNFTPENLPVGVIVNEYQFEQYLQSPEFSIAVNLEGDTFPGVYELVKNQTTWKCINNSDYLKQHYIRDAVSKFLDKVIWINLWGYPFYFLGSEYCNNSWQDQLAGKGFIRLGTNGVAYAGILPGYNSFTQEVTVNINQQFFDYMNQTFGIVLPKQVGATSTLGACSDTFYSGLGCLGYVRKGTGGLVVLGSDEALLGPVIVYLEHRYANASIVKPTTFYIVFLSRISLKQEMSIIQQAGALGG